MAITLVGQAGINGANATSPQTITYTSSPGNALIVVAHLLDNATGGNAGLVSITDNATGGGNTWHYSTAASQNPPYGADLADGAFGSTFAEFVAWTYQDKGPVTSVTVTRADTGSQWWRLTVAEFSDIALFDNGAASDLTSSPGGGATTFSPGTVTINAPGGFVVAAVDCFFGTLTGASGMTSFTAGSPGDLQYVINPATGPYAPSWSSSQTADGWAGALAVFGSGTAANAGAATGTGQAISGLRIVPAGTAAGTGAAGAATTPGANLTVTAGNAAGSGSAPVFLAGPGTTATGTVFGGFTDAQVTSSNNDTLLNANVWNPGGATSQTQVMTVGSPLNGGKWAIQSNIVNTTGAVISYPDVEQPYYDKPLTAWTAITSSWAETMNTNPATDMAEAAFDIWLNDYGNEVMIWTDITPLQHNTLNFDHYYGQVTISGQLLDYWHGGGATEIIYALHANQPTGTVDVLGVLNHAETNGLIPANSTLTAIEYGWEISTTNGVPRTFQMSSFSITETRNPGLAFAGAATGTGAARPATASASTGTGTAPLMAIFP